MLAGHTILKTAGKFLFKERVFEILFCLGRRKKDTKFL